MKKKLEKWLGQSDLPKSLAETGQITRRDKNRNWTEPQEAIGAKWASDLPKSLAESAQITLIAENTAEAGKEQKIQIQRKEVQTHFKHYKINPKSHAPHLESSILNQTQNSKRNQRLQRRPNQIEITKP